MVVVKYGHIKPMYAFCAGCGAILEFNKSDQRMSNKTLQNGLQNNGKDFFITCPVCSRVIYELDFKESQQEC